jgi:hypothetical protein
MCPYTRNVPCFVALFALISPRLAIFLLWIFSDRLTIAFTSGWVGILGFLFLPWTMLAWAVCYAPFLGVQGFGWFIVILGFIADIGSYTSGRSARSSQPA